MERIFIVGTGRIGTGMALALADRGLRLIGAYNRGADGRARAEGLVGQPISGGDLCLAPGLGEATVILLCVADTAIRGTASTLARAALAPGVVVAHTSGCLDASELAAVTGAARGSIHPLCACPAPETAAAALKQSLYAIEGESAAVRRLTAVAGALSGRHVIIDTAQKPRYHAAAVMASNLVVGLVDQAIAEARLAGLDPQWAKEALVELATGALARVGETDTARALTGPVARGDAETVARHLELLGGGSRDIYLALSRRALELARQRGLPEEAARELASLLGGD